MNEASGLSDVPPVLEVQPVHGSGPVRDDLLECLVHISALHGRAVSPDTIRSGLPLTGGILTIDLLPRAAARAGLSSKIVQRPLNQLSGVVLPAVVCLTGGGFVVVEEIDRASNTARIACGGYPQREIAMEDLARDHLGYIVLLSPVGGNEDAGVATHRHGRVEGHWFWSTIKAFWPNYLQVVVAALVINVLALAMPLFTMNVYDRVIPNFAVPTLIALSIGITFALVFDFVLRQVRGEIVEIAGKKADMILAGRIFEHVLSVSLAKRPVSAGAFAHQVREFETVRDFFTSATLISLTDLLFIFIFLLVMFMLVGPLTLVPLIAVPIIIGITLLIQIPLEKAVQETQREAAMRHSVLIEAIGGLETVKAVAGEGRLQSAWDRAVAATARSSHAARFWSTLATGITSFFTQFVSIAILLWGVFLVQDGTVTAGALIASMMLSGRVLGPLASISATLTRAQQTRVALRGLNAVMELEGERPRGARFVARTVNDGSLAFEGVSFTYPESPVPALSDITFRIAPGERVGVIGRMGSGKTTLGRLVSGLYAPEEGIVLVDGIDARQYDPADLRRGVALVGQDADLFSGSLRDNIVFGRPEASDAEVVAAARLAGVDDFAGRHPKGYAMPIGERGRSLSGGQRQCVGLARALIRDPRILFLDEPTSAMDVASEREFLIRLTDVARGGRQTIVISTHRLSLLNLVDRLLVFERGKLVADGPRDKVLEKLRMAASARAEGLSPS